MNEIHHLQHLAVEYGALIYALIFFWTFFEGETFVIFAGFVAHRGFLDWGLVFAAAWFGSFAGDQLYFWIGRKWGAQILKRLPRWRGGVETALGWLRKHDTVFILSFRFIYGVRNFASFAMGMSGVDPVRFALLNFCAAFVWALSFAGGGYLFGRAIEKMFGGVIEGAHMLEFLGLGMLVVILGGFSLGGFMMRRRRARLPAVASAASNTPAQ